LQEASDMPKIDKESVLHRLPRLAGQRLTTQRILLLELVEKTEGQLDVYEIYRRAKERNRKISLSTVYRALRLFTDLGIVDDLQQDEHHYHAPKLSHEHYHLVCIGCGQVVEFESELVDALKESVGTRHNFDVTRGEVNLSGYCERCRKAGASS
jgi:Fur family ferric uptake transcriptional regulator